MFKGFKEFIRRGNVIDLAIGVVIGVSFNTLVKQFGDSFLTPLIQLFTGGKKVSGTFTIMQATFSYGAFLSALIVFLLTAAALYYLVVAPMNRLAELRRGGEDDPRDAPPPSEEVVLLTQIRDALESRRKIF